MFTDEQKKMLAADFDSRHIKQRDGFGGKKLSYIESWHAIAEANRIFGHDGWSRYTEELKLLSEKEVDTRNGKRWSVAYLAKSRIEIPSHDPREDNLMREGYGTGTGLDVDLGKAHESALKEAESDAMKRALSTFGWQFGLALYDPTRAHVSNGHEEAPARDIHVEADREVAAKPKPKLDMVKARQMFEAAAKQGRQSFHTLWQKARPETREIFAGNLEDWQTIAIKADIDREAAEHA